MADALTDTRATVQEFFRRLGTWEADAVGELFADDVDWLVPGASSLPWVGRRARREEVPEHLTTMWSHFHTDQSTASIDRIVVEGEQAVGLGSFSHVANTTGRRSTTPVATHITVRQGCIHPRPPLRGHPCGRAGVRRVSVTERACTIPGARIEGIRPRGARHWARR
jgi:ketosteroid isomerase-like protein